MITLFHVKLDGRLLIKAKSKKNKKTKTKTKKLRTNQSFEVVDPSNTDHVITPT